MNNSLKREQILPLDIIEYVEWEQPVLYSCAGSGLQVDECCADCTEQESD